MESIHEVSLPIARTVYEHLHKFYLSTNAGWNYIHISTRCRNKGTETLLQMYGITDNAWTGNTYICDKRIVSSHVTPDGLVQRQQTHVEMPVAAYQITFIV